MDHEEQYYLLVGTEVSAKYGGAFCEAKIKSVKKSVSFKISIKKDEKVYSVAEDAIKGTKKVGSTVEVHLPETAGWHKGVVLGAEDKSTYTVEFDDGNVGMLSRGSLCLRGESQEFAQALQMNTTLASYRVDNNSQALPDNQFANIAHGLAVRQAPSTNVQQFSSSLKVRSHTGSIPMDRSTPMQTSSSIYGLQRQFPHAFDPMKGSIPHEPHQNILPQQQSMWMDQFAGPHSGFQSDHLIRLMMVQAQQQQVGDGGQMHHQAARYQHGTPPTAMMQQVTRPQRCPVHSPSPQQMHSTGHHQFRASINLKRQSQVIGEMRPHKIRMIGQNTSMDSTYGLTTSPSFQYVAGPDQNPKQSTKKMPSKSLHSTNPNSSAPMQASSNMYGLHRQFLHRFDPTTFSHQPHISILPQQQPMCMDQFASPYAGFKPGHATNQMMVQAQQQQVGDGGQMQYQAVSHQHGTPPTAMMQQVTRPQQHPVHSPSPQQMHSTGENQEIAQAQQMNTTLASYPVNINSQASMDNQFANISRSQTVQWPPSSNVQQSSSLLKVQSHAGSIPMQRSIQNEISHAFMAPYTDIHMSQSGIVVSQASMSSQSALVMSHSNVIAFQGTMSTQSSFIRSKNTMMTPQGNMVMSPAVSGHHQFCASMNSKRQGQAIGEMRPHKIQMIGQNTSINSTYSLTTSTPFHYVAGPDQNPKQRKPTKKMPSKSSCNTNPNSSAPMQASSNMYGLHGQFPHRFDPTKGSFSHQPHISILPQQQPMCVDQFAGPYPEFKPGHATNQMMVQAQQQQVGDGGQMQYQAVSHQHGTPPIAMMQQVTRPQQYLVHSRTPPQMHGTELEADQLHSSSVAPVCFISSAPRLSALQRTSQKEEQIHTSAVPKVGSRHARVHHGNKIKHSGNVHGDVVGGSKQQTFDQRGQIHLHNCNISPQPNTEVLNDDDDNDCKDEIWSNLKKSLKRKALEICGEEDQFLGKNIQLAELQISTEPPSVDETMSGHGHHRNDIARYFNKPPHGSIPYTRLFEEVKRIAEEEASKNCRTQEAAKKFALKHGSVVFLSGNPGIGKTTLTKRLVEEMWQDYFSKPDFILFFIRFRDVDFQAKTDLLELFAPFEIANFSETKRRNILSKLSENSEHVYIIMDGLDEADIEPRNKVKPISNLIKTQTTAENFVKNLIAGNILPQSKKIVTSRPYRFIELLEELRPKVLFTIQGLNNSGIDQICNDICGKDQQSLRKSILDHLEAKPDLKSYCHTPVTCIMVITSLKEIYYENTTLLDMVSHTLTAIFVTVITKWHSKKPGFPGKFQMKEICLLAFDGFWNGQFYFPACRLEEIGVNFDQNSAFINAILKGSNKFLYFVHLMWQELLAALYLRLYMDEEKLKNCLPELNAQKYEMVARFLFGVCNDQVLNDLLEFVEVKERNTKSVRDRCKEILKQFAIKELQKHRDAEKKNVDGDPYFSSILPILNWVREMGDIAFTKQAASCLRNELEINKQIFPSDIPSIHHLLRARDDELALAVVRPTFVGNCSNYFYKELLDSMDNNKIRMKKLFIDDIPVDGAVHLFIFSRCIDEVEHLALIRCNITNQIVGELVQRIKKRNKKMKWLNLGSNAEISDKGAAMLKEVLGR